ncbi:MAG: IS1 family transposase [Capsulimonadaceae bacterium]
MNTLNNERRVAVIKCLVEGCSIRSTVRITGVAKNTVSKLLVDLGQACADFHNNNVIDVQARRVECDEIWSFVGCKEKNKPEDERGTFGRGDVWTWTAIDAESKLIISWLVGERTPDAAYAFMTDVAGRLANRVQLTTDGLKCYLTAVRGAFGNDIDYAMLVKTYGNDPGSEKRYSPAICTGCERKDIIGTPNNEYISTSYVERQNLTMRMGMRRFTRLTNAFSKKAENHAAAIALHFMYINFVRVHMTLGTTPAIAAGLTDRVWTVEDLVGLMA